MYIEHAHALALPEMVHVCVHVRTYVCKIETWKAGLHLRI